MHANCGTDMAIISHFGSSTKNQHPELDPAVTEKFEAQNPSPVDSTRDSSEAVESLVERVKAVNNRIDYVSSGANRNADAPACWNPATSSTMWPAADAILYNIK